MRKNEFKRLLMELGYRQIPKISKRHENWKKNDHILVVPRGGGELNSRLEKKLLVDLRRGGPRFFCREAE